MEEAVMCAKKPKKNKRKRQRESRLRSMDVVVEESCSSQEIEQIAQTAAETVFNDLLDKVAAFSLDPPPSDTLSETPTPEESLGSITEALDKAKATFEEIATAIGKLSHENIENYEDEHDLNEGTGTTNGQLTYEIIKNEDQNVLHEKLDENEIKVNSEDTEASPDTEIQLTSEPECDENECKLNYINQDVVSEEVPHDDIELVEQETELSEKPSVDHIIAPLSRISLHETDSKEDNPQPPVLKPSVFVGRDKLYHSSLQLGCSWDRTKYNIVLLPDLKKVVYPDLDSLLSGKPANTISSLGDDLLMSSTRRRIDRSCKPMPVTMPAIVHPSVQPIVKYHDISKEIAQQAHPPPVNEVNTVKFDIPKEMEHKVNLEHIKFTEYNFDGIDFRVYMNPVKWNPRDHHNQLVLFRVGPIFHEEFFTNCGTTDRFIKAIKDRAEALAKHQLMLAQACLLGDGGNSKLINLQDTTLAIYNMPSRVDKRSTMYRIRFGVNEGFYEEDFRDCKSVKDIVESVKRRAAIISTQQRLLKTKANSETKPGHDDIGWCIPPESNSDVIQSIENSTYDYVAGSSDINQQNDIYPPQPPLPPEEIVGTSLEADEARTDNKLRRTIKSVRNWFKGTFTKKSSKRSKKSHSGNDVFWQWNDGSPASFSSSRIIDDSENGKE